MEFRDYLLNTAKRRRYLQALEKLPSVIAQMAAHEGIRIRDYLLSVRMYTHGGLQLSLEHFWLNKKELLVHMEQAEEQGCEICVEGITITIRRNLPDGKYVIAFYEHTAKAE